MEFVTRLVVGLSGFVVLLILPPVIARMVFHSPLSNGAAQFFNVVARDYLFGFLIFLSLDTAVRYR